MIEVTATISVAASSVQRSSQWRRASSIGSKESDGWAIAGESYSAGRSREPPGRYGHVMEPRITPATRSQLGFVNSLIVGALGRATGGPPPHIFTTLGRHRSLFRRW